MKAYTKNGDKASHIVDLTIQGWAGEVGGQLHALTAVSPVASLHIYWFGAGWPSQPVKVWQQGPKSGQGVVARTKIPAPLGNQPQSSKSIVICFTELSQPIHIKPEMTKEQSRHYGGKLQ